MADGGEGKEAREAAWWAAWRKQDFSWPGLAAKELQGWSVRGGFLVETESGLGYGPAAPASSPLEGEQATLQDYWRADPATGRLRSDRELIAAGELLLRPASGLLPPPAGGGQGGVKSLEIREAGTPPTPAPPPQAGEGGACGSAPRRGGGRAERGRRG